MIPNAASAQRVIELFEQRGQLDRLEMVGPTDPTNCLTRGQDRLRAAHVLIEASLWEAAYTTAYDAFRTAADAVVLQLGFRVPATKGAHRIATDIADAAVGGAAFTAATAEQFRQGRHESEYFDPTKPVDKTEADARWAVATASAGIAAAESALSSI